ncbi:MAG: HAD-IA family hydrolase [Butyrivibrio sp.]|nr:HAD-IA family hydrolase [Butyrivibrio sp.]
MKYKAVIFDMDGTVLNTLDDIKDSVNAVLLRHGLKEQSLDEIRHYVGNGAGRLIEQVLPEGRKEPLFTEILTEYEEYYFHHCNIKTGPYAHILDLMKELKNRGYLLAIVSNKPMDAVLELNSKYFGEYVSVAVGVTDGLKRKPAPDECVFAMEKLGVEPSDCIYVGDSEVDHMTAINSGLPCISCLWGFRTKEELVAAGAGENAFVTDPMEILELV